MASSVVLDIVALRSDDFAEVEWIEAGFDSTTSFDASRSVSMDFWRKFGACGNGTSSMSTASTVSSAKSAGSARGFQRGMIPCRRGRDTSKRVRSRQLRSSIRATPRSSVSAVFKEMIHEDSIAESFGDDDSWASTRSGASSPSSSSDSDDSVTSVPDSPSFAQDEVASPVHFFIGDETSETDLPTHEGMGPVHFYIGEEDAELELTSFVEEATPLTQSGQCDICELPYTGFGDVCAACRKCRPSQGVVQQCVECGDYYHGFGQKCTECRH